VLNDVRFWRKADVGRTPPTFRKPATLQSLNGGACGRLKVTRNSCKFGLDQLDRTVNPRYGPRFSFSPCVRTLALTVLVAT
jgi:hypothetical protein